MWPALGVVVAVALWPTIRDLVRRHPYFTVREVAVRPHGRLSAESIRVASGLVPGMSIWDVHCASVAARLRRQPWVRSAVVRRELPHRVVIQVREFRPAAILALGDKLYYVAANGRVFATVDAADAHDLAYVTGLTEKDLGARDAFGPRAIRRALGLLRAAARTNTGGTLGAVSEVHVDRTRGLTLLPVQPTVPIEIGWDGFAPRLARLGTVLAEWRGRETEIVAVSLRFDDQVIVRTRSTAQPPARRGNRI